MSEPERDPFTEPFPEPEPRLAPVPEPERPHIIRYRRHRIRRARAFAMGVVVGAAATWIVVLIASVLGHSTN